MYDTNSGDIHVYIGPTAALSPYPASISLTWAPMHNVTTGWSEQFSTFLPEMGLGGCLGWSINNWNNIPFAQAQRLMFLEVGIGIPGFAYSRYYIFPGANLEEIGVYWSGVAKQIGGWWGNFIEQAGNALIPVVNSIEEQANKVKQS